MKPAIETSTTNTSCFSSFIAMESAYRHAKKSGSQNMEICSSLVIEMRDAILNQAEEIERLQEQLSQYPMQPISEDGRGVLRFEVNPIIDWLATEASDMNQIAIWCHENDVDNKYREQLAQMVGYSLSGYGILSYVSDESYDRAVNSIPTPLKGEGDE